MAFKLQVLDGYHAQPNEHGSQTLYGPGDVFVNEVNFAAADPRKFKLVASGVAPLQDKGPAPVPSLGAVDAPVSPPPPPISPAIDARDPTPSTPHRTKGDKAGDQSGFKS